MAATCSSAAPASPVSTQNNSVAMTVIVPGTLTANVPGILAANVPVILTTNDPGTDST